MSGIFNNKIHTSKLNPGSAATQAPPAVESEKIDLNKYQDVNDLSLKKIRVGLWFVENRLFFTKIFYGILIIISVVTWSLFVYTYGSYLFKGMNDDYKMVNEMTATTINLHDFSAAVRAKNLIYDNIDVFALPENKTDLVVRIKNPNDRYWAEFTYYFKSGDQEYGRENNFIMPGEEKYLMALGLSLMNEVSNMQFYPAEIKWHLVDPHKYPDWKKFAAEHLDINFINKKYVPAQSSLITEKISLNELEFTIENKTAYNYAQISFPVVLLGGMRVAGVNKYIAQDLMSGQSRQIKLTWPGVLGNVTDVLITPEINITRDDIYLRFEGETRSYLPELKPTR